MSKMTFYMGKGGSARPARPTDKNVTTEGVAKTGQISPLGTVSHIEHRDGSVDADVRPNPIKATLKMET